MKRKCIIILINLFYSNKCLYIYVLNLFAVWLFLLWGLWARNLGSIPLAHPLSSSVTLGQWYTTSLCPGFGIWQKRQQHKSYFLQYRVVDWYCILLLMIDSSWRAAWKGFWHFSPSHRAPFLQSAPNSNHSTVIWRPWAVFPYLCSEAYHC